MGVGDPQVQGLGERIKARARRDVAASPRSTRIEPMYEEIADLARTRLSKAFGALGRDLSQRDRHIREDAASRGVARSGSEAALRQAAHLESVRRRCDSVATVWADLIE